MAQEKLAEAANLLDTLIEENPDDKQLWLQQANALIWPWSARTRPP
jgi:hypothetical protein